MRNYPGYPDWPENRDEAHKMLIRAWRHLKNREAKEFETLDAREIINHAQLEVSEECDAEPARQLEHK